MSVGVVSTLFKFYPKRAKTIDVRQTTVVFEASLARPNRYFVTHNLIPKQHYGIHFCTLAYTYLLL